MVNADDENTAPADSGERMTAVAALISRAARAGMGAPPVERWNPESCGDLDIEIRRDGSWFYLGTPIGREALVRLFSTVLRKDADGRTYLVTPVEKIGIRVEDAPFLAVEMDAGRRAGEQVLTFRTNVGDVVEAGPQHPLRFELEPETGGLKPYVTVRGRLEALATRPVMHELAGIAEEIEVDGRSVIAIRSHGAIFPIMPAEDLSGGRS